MRKSVLLIALSSAVGCGSPSLPLAAPAPPAAPAPAAAGAPAVHAPRPFTAEQIRDAMPAGHQIRFRMEVEGKPTTVAHWVVTAAGEKQMTLSSNVYSEDGELVQDEGSETSTWTALMAHATFPADRTTVRDAEIEVPAGKLSVVVYEVRERGEDGVEAVTRFHFAKKWPGPPVLLTTERGGKTVRSMTLIERR